MSESFNLPLLRAWCRKNDAWLSFRTRFQDRYFINPYGYFVELPDGRLAQVTARVAFPLINCYPSAMLSDLEVQSGFGSASYFVYAIKDGAVTGQPQSIRLSQLRQELDGILPISSKLSPPERYLAIRLLEAGLLTETQLEGIIRELPSGRSLGQQIVSGELCRWEVLMSTCLDTRSPGNFDPPSQDRKTFLREWELAGEILIAMEKISRSKLEYALRIKKEGQRTIGEILTAIGACSQEDVDECLIIQDAVREARGAEVGLIGELLVKRGLISAQGLADAVQRQRISGQPLANILMALGTCTTADIEEYKAANNWHAFQGEIEDNNLASWLLMNKRVSEQQIQQAVAVQGRGRQVLGQIVVAMGFCSPQQLDETVRMQEGVRRAYRSGIERLGSLLLESGKINPEDLETAIGLQSNARRALGEILMAVGGCSESAVRLAIELQRVWREKMEGQDDRLGAVLVQRGCITEDILSEAIAVQRQSEKPLGRVLVEMNWCTPEEIIATLLMRDYKRQCDLHAFIKKSLAMLPDMEAQEGFTTERMLAAWFTKKAAQK